MNREEIYDTQLHLKRVRLIDSQSLGGNHAHPRRDCQCVPVASALEVDYGENVLEWLEHFRPKKASLLPQQKED